MDEPSRIGQQLLGLDAHVRRVEIRIDGRVETVERDSGSPSGGDEPEVASMRRGKAGAPERRAVEIRRGLTWELRLGCRGGSVSLDVDLKGDPLDIAAAADQMLLGLGR